MMPVRLVEDGRYEELLVRKGSADAVARDQRTRKT